MPNVLIRDLDPSVHAALAARAEAHGQSLQQYLTAELTRLAGQPTLAELLADFATRPPQPQIPTSAIIAAVGDGREG
ncbi:MULTISPECIES: FitA-like ribbon-helix-helix domain-containing protein [unclassified Microbacterium]|uniref:FitA-like ribbon-helix-helix domain-containing protein n=1 Tax=unclassified Microbacterium TaxID=2609290 RepID=UPI0015FF8974|nr:MULTISPECIES: antitoxin [unclassified Microbacterium]MBT2484309.1 hypothetical protein [Microbacterium sp. ISL-108]